MKLSNLQAILIIAAVGMLVVLCSSLAKASGIVNKVAPGETRLTKLVSECNSCHGAEAITQFDTYPILKGQKPAYLQRQLENFKSGARSHAFMSGVAAQLSKEDIKKLSDYYGNAKGIELNRTSGK